ncbi:MAG: hypothetical protein WDO73_02415 [Ignavibacteriota bacterium]
MLRVLTVLFTCAAVQAATSSATLQVQAKLTPGVSGNYTASGTGTVTGGISASGSFNATFDTTTVISGGKIQFTITTTSGYVGRVADYSDHRF